MVSGSVLLSSSVADGFFSSVDMMRSRVHVSPPPQICRSGRLGCRPSVRWECPTYVPIPPFPLTKWPPRQRGTSSLLSSFNFRISAVRSPCTVSSHMLVPQARSSRVRCDLRLIQTVAHPGSVLFSCCSRARTRIRGREAPGSPLARLWNFS